jgi:hypothetical protein
MQDDTKEQKSSGGGVWHLPFSTTRMSVPTPSFLQACVLRCRSILTRLAASKATSLLPTYRQTT